MKATRYIVLILAVSLAMTGCSGKKKLLAEKDMEITRLQSEVDRLQGRVSDQEEISNELEADLKSALADLEETEQVCLEEREGCQRITISDAATFSSGSAMLTAQGRQILDRVWDVLSDYPDRGILIEGHTDNVPISPKWQHRFESNWELSMARALAVLHYVTKSKQAEAKRLTVVGYGEFRPIAGNDTPEGRAKNRRVVITVRDWI